MSDERVEKIKYIKAILTSMGFDDTNLSEVIGSINNIVIENIEGGKRDKLESFSINTMARHMYNKYSVKELRQISTALNEDKELAKHVAVLKKIDKDLYDEYDKLKFDNNNPLFNSNDLLVDLMELQLYTMLGYFHRMPQGEGEALGKLKGDIEVDYLPLIKVLRDKIKATTNLARDRHNKAFESSNIKGNISGLLADIRSELPGELKIKKIKQIGGANSYHYESLAKELYILKNTQRMSSDDRKQIERVINQDIQTRINIIQSLFQDGDYDIETELGKVKNGMEQQFNKLGLMTPSGAHRLSSSSPPPPPPLPLRPKVKVKGGNFWGGSYEQKYTKHNSRYIELLNNKYTNN